MTNDTGQMEDYADDIDTLLVFVSTLHIWSIVCLSSSSTGQAGLFSAILTAFLVQTYPMLQADGTDTTNQLLALSVSTQLRAAGTIISDTLNQTLLTLADAVSTSFSPSTATRWINILFFLSLVFSLAAALLSILAKQWIREYIKWNSPLALPRENVIVRQIRIEAWEDWQVSMVLSSIPILLELGMILFLAGVIILLWTLDDVVAITLTVFISLFLGAFATFTVMPIFFKRCPYRSPTAWACFVAFYFLASYVRYFIRAMQIYVLRLKRAWQYWKPHLLGRPGMATPSSPYLQGLSAVRPDRVQTWRDCDLESRRVTVIRNGRWWPKTIYLRQAAREELAREKIDFMEDGTLPVDVMIGFGVPDDASRVLLVNIVEVSYLVRALAWVQQSSQSTQVVAYIDQCMNQLHRDTADAPDWAESIHMITIWCVLLSVVNDRARSPHFALLAGSDDDQGGITRLRKRWSGYSDFQRVLSIPRPLRHLFPILMRLLAQPAMQRTTDPLNVSSHFLRRCKELLGALEHTASYNSLYLSSADPSHTWYHNVWTTIRRVYGPHDDMIRLMTFDHLHTKGKVTIGQDQTLCKAHTALYLLFGCPLIINYLAFSQGYMGTNDCEFLLLHYFDNADDVSDEYLNMFIITSGSYLLFLIRPSVTTLSILEKMISVAETISRRQRRDTHRVWHAEDAVWIEALSWKKSELSEEDCAKLFRQLLHIFERSYILGVLVGDLDDIKLRLHECLEAAHQEHICEVAFCPWAFHSCGFPYSGDECTLLPSMATVTVQHSIHDDPDLRTAPASVADYSISHDPAHDSRHPLPAYPYVGPPALWWSSITRIHAHAPVDSFSSGLSTNSSLLSHPPAILRAESVSDPEATADGPSALSPGTALVEATSDGGAVGSAAQVVSAPPRPRASLTWREQVASEDPTGDRLSIRSVQEDRDTERTTAEDSANLRIPSRSHIVEDSTHSASARTSIVGPLGPSNADAVIHNTVADRPAHHTMSQEFPLGPGVPVEGSPPGERAAGAQREEGGPIRVAAVLFQGEANDRGESGEEMIELTR